MNSQGAFPPWAQQKEALSIAAQDQSQSPRDARVAQQLSMPQLIQNANRVKAVSVKCLTERSSQVGSRADERRSKLNGFQSPELMKQSLLRQQAEKALPAQEAAKKRPGGKNAKRKVGKMPSTKLHNPPMAKSCFNLSELFCVQPKKEQDRASNGQLAEPCDAYLSDPALEHRREVQEPSAINQEESKVMIRIHDPVADFG